MWASILALIPSVLPILLQAIQLYLQKTNATQATYDAFAQLVESTKNDGLISIQIYDGFQNLDAKLKADLAAKDANKPT